MMAGSLGLELNWTQLTDMGGGSVTGNVARASAAIRAGLCDVVLVLASDAESTENKGNAGLWHEARRLHRGPRGKTLTYRLRESFTTG
jgi:acetyl-CoA acetyltransferase